MARARYSTWLGATKPTFIDTESQSLVRLQLRRARHPLLVQRHREALRDAKAALKSKSKVLDMFLPDTNVISSLHGAPDFSCYGARFFTSQGICLINRPAGSCIHEVY